MEKSKDDPCVFRKVVDGEVTLVVCVHADNIIVGAKDKNVRCILCAATGGIVCE